MPLTPAPFLAASLADGVRPARPAPRAVSAEHARLVAHSWSIALGRGEVLAAAFTSYLVAFDPSLRLLFLGENPEQARERGRRLVHALDVAIANLHRFEVRDDAPSGWDAVGAALFAALGQVLGMAFTPPLREAWLAAYGAIAAAMRAAAASTPAGMAA